ncbi:hypothetical protein [Ruminococcus sp.]|uniref:hypothetical protein n=1 Tax=Ruminococcus sp. TaxID=41978 RepID=UPI0026010994|nr:hypothetical protein [Ruminococcus sp.]MCI6616731.1 hypothetical protein [Ruminococcus sp.]
MILIFNIFIFLVVVVAILIGSYYLAIHIIKLWTGCDYDGAITKLHNLFNGKAHCQLNTDMAFINEIWNNVHNIIGDKRYQQLVRLNNTMIDTPLLCFDDNGKIPSINISLYYSDENERLILENIICNVVKKYLKIYGYSSESICKWFVRYDLNMPYLQIYYAKTAEQRMALRAYIQNEQNNLVGQNVDLTDDTEDDDLNG